MSSKKSKPVYISLPLKQFVVGAGVGIAARAGQVLSRIKGASKYATGAKIGAAALGIYGEVDAISSSVGVGREFGVLSGIGTYALQTATRVVGANVGVKAANKAGSLVMSAAAAGRARSAAKAAASAADDVGRTVKGTVQTAKGKTIFRRVRGRIIPVRVQIGGK